MDSIRTLESRVYTQQQYRQQSASVRVAVEAACTAVQDLWDANANGAQRDEWADTLMAIADTLRDSEQARSNTIAELRG